MDTKLKLYSNFNKVRKKAKELHLNTIYISNRADKKYMVSNGTRMIHFGQMGYEDYTKHRDKKRRDNFTKRNHKWANHKIYSPAWLSYHLLW